MHARYNPEAITQYNIVPGLMGVILTMTMVLMTGLAITRERERGTMENLLSMPATALEVMIGKIVPYMSSAHPGDAGPDPGAPPLRRADGRATRRALLAVLLFIAANLALGLTFSTVARNQLQAMQMTFFFFLPSMLLSGFMFPFRGMPGWAQTIGEVLPLTHFLRIVRGILLKGNALADVAAPDLADRRVHGGRDADRTAGVPARSTSEAREASAERSAKRPTPSAGRPHAARRVHFCTCKPCRSTPGSPSSSPPG